MALSRNMIVFAVLAAAGCHASLTGADAEHRAREFMRNLDGEDPDQAGLNELKATNPDAFAIVNALLTKRSLGMLNVRHPSASFSPGADASPPEDRPTAVDTLRASMPQHEAPVEAAVQPAMDVPVSAMAVQAPRSHGNWLNWKPHSDDDAMVENVLGAVADLKNGGGASQAPEPQPQPQPQPQPTFTAPQPEPAQPAFSAAVTDSRMGSMGRGQSDSVADALATEALPPRPAPVQHHDTALGSLSFDWGSRYNSPDAVKPAPAMSMHVATPVADQLPKKNDDNPYLKGIDFSSDLGVPLPAAQASMSQQNSYLRGSGLDGSQAASAPASKPVELDNGQNKLTSFSWYADNSNANTGMLQQSQSTDDQAPVSQPAPQASPGDNLVNGALQGWLSH